MENLTHYTDQELSLPYSMSQTDSRTYKVFHDAAGYHTMFYRNGSASGWSFNHSTREEAETAGREAVSVAEDVT